MRSRGVNSPDRADAMVLAFCGGGGKRMDEYLKALGEDGRSLLERMEDEIGPVEETGSPLAGCEVGGRKGAYIYDERQTAGFVAGPDC